MIAKCWKDALFFKSVNNICKLSSLLTCAITGFDNYMSKNVKLHPSSKWLLIKEGMYMCLKKGYFGGILYRLVTKCK